VNYYERHIGDWIKDTVALSMLEDGAYNRLIDQCYQTEKPLPKDKKEIFRAARANSKAEKDAVLYVLGKFFVETPDGYVQKRVELELARYVEKKNKAQASANARWSKDKPASDQHANASPPHDAQDMRTHSERNALQSPVTSNHSKKEPKGSSSAAKLPTCQTQAVIDLYHETLPNLPKVRLQTKDRTKAIRKLWDWALTSKKSDQTPRATNAPEALNWFKTYFARASENDFLMGRTHRAGEHANWQCDLDFLLTERGMKHVIEKTNTGDTQ
jgi:uncharacterized protein YdaU (DUF1376 family)